MGWNYEITCPKCHELVAEHMTDGFIDAHLIDDKE